MFNKKEEEEEIKVALSISYKNGKPAIKYTLDNVIHSEASNEDLKTFEAYLELIKEENKADKERNNFGKDQNRGKSGKINVK